MFEKIIKKNIKLLVKLIWFLFAFISVCILHFRDYGIDVYFDYNTITRNDILFVLLIILIFVPFFTGFQIKTPWLELTPEEELEKQKSEFKNVTSEYDKKMEQTMDNFNESDREGSDL